LYEMRCVYGSPTTTTWKAIVVIVVVVVFTGLIGFGSILFALLTRARRKRARGAKTGSMFGPEG